MAKVKSYETITIELTLTHQEALLLRAILQNQSENEHKDDSKVRESIWTELNTILNKLNNFQEGKPC